MNRRMPQGTLVPFMTALPERYERILKAGIPLFELKRSAINYQGTKDFGYWDVRVGEYVGTNLVVHRTAKWFKGHHSYIEYRPTKKGFCFAFCPDDDAWYNRIKLSSVIHSGRFTIEQYLTKDGVISGSRMTEEIVALSNYIHDWAVFSGKEILFRSKSKQDCVQFIRDEAAKNPEKSFNIQRVKIEPIRQLSKRYPGKWFFSPEFETEIKPKIIEHISGLFTKRPNPYRVVDELKNMNEAERSVIREFLLPGVDLAALERLSKMSTGTPVQFGHKEEEQETKLEDLKFNDLRSLAKSTYHINTKGMNRESLIEAIKEQILPPKDNKDEENSLPQRDNYEEDPVNDPSRYDFADSDDEEEVEFS